MNYGKTTLVKNNKSHSLTVPNETLKLAIVSLLKSNSISIEETGLVIKINSSNIKTLPEYLHYKKKLIPYDTIGELVSAVIYIEKELEKMNKSIIYYDFEDIVVIDNKVFLFINDSKITEILNDSISINYPLSKSLPFLHPEIKNADILPLILSYKASYYSLGMIVIKLLLPEKHEILLTDELSKMLYPTKLYWFLSNSLNEIPENRKLIIL